MLLFNHFIGAGEQRGRNGEAQYLGGFEVDNQLKLGWRLDRQITRLSPFKSRSMACRGLHAFLSRKQDVDDRDKPGHDEQKFNASRKCF